MHVIFDILYAAGLVAATPVLAIKSLRTGKYRTDWPARFGRYAQQATLKPAGMYRLMFHCVSVGELLSMRKLVDGLLAADAALQIIITTTTDTGTARARELYAGNPRVMCYRYPLDFSFAVEAFLDHAQPDAIALVELEVWPNFVNIAVDRRIPVCIINGRITERATRRYRVVKPIIAAALQRLAFIAAQTATIAERFKQLGAPAERIEIVPTIKYDSADFSDSIAGAETLAEACGIEQGHKLFVAGSTAPGEEGPVLEAYLALRDQHPGLRLAIAPRKPETVPGTLAAIAAAGLRPVQRTARPDGAEGRALEASEVLVLDTMGELKKLYSLATAVFVGRSLVDLGGSDMIEVAALAKPLCFGPHTQNFAEAVELLLSNQAAVLVRDGATLTATLRAWLADGAAARQLGLKARETVASQRGSTTIYLEKLLALVRMRTSRNGC